MLLFIFIFLRLYFIIPGIHFTREKAKVLSRRNGIINLHKTSVYLHLHLSSEKMNNSSATKVVFVDLYNQYSTQTLTVSQCIKLLYIILIL